MVPNTHSALMRIDFMVVSPCDEPDDRAAAPMPSREAITA
jgi:hypothetical protein